MIEFYACLESGRSYKLPDLIHIRKPQKHCKLLGILELQPRGVSWSDKKFNGRNFEAWNLKMEDILVYREQWVVVNLSTTPTSMPSKYCHKINRKTRSTRI